jgi:hypothetical protein
MLSILGVKKLRKHQEKLREHGLSKCLAVHALLYVVVNSTLVLSNFWTHGFPWSFVVLTVWGAGLALHGLRTKFPEKDNSFTRHKIIFSAFVLLMFVSFFYLPCRSRGGRYQHHQQWKHHQASQVGHSVGRTSSSIPPSAAAARASPTPDIARMTMPPTPNMHPGYGHKQSPPPPPPAAATVPDRHQQKKPARWWHHHHHHHHHRDHHHQYQHHQYQYQRRRKGCCILGSLLWFLPVLVWGILFGLHYKRHKRQQHQLQQQQQQLQGEVVQQPQQQEQQPTATATSTVPPTVMSCNI